MAPPEPPAGADRPHTAPWRAGFALPARRRLTLAALAVAVLALHVWVGERVVDGLLSFDRPNGAPARLQAAFVRTLAPAAPPPVETLPPRMAASPAAAAAAVAAPTPAASAPHAASAPAPPASADEPVPSAAAASPPPAEPASAATGAPASAVAGASAPDGEASSAARPAVAAAAGPAGPASAGAAASQPGTADGPSFRWPASTRLSYVLSGNLRGEVHGSAQVEWVRSGERYQVHLDVTVGLPFAPLMSRRMSSDGVVGPRGLVPDRYDEETKIGFGDRRRNALLFDEEGITLADGRRVPLPPAALGPVQDAASQFVQLVYLFRTGSAPLAAGGQVTVPLALPRRADPWIYDVTGTQTLYTPFGHLDAWHLVPRPVADNGVLAMELWFAPSLQYLPVRIVIRRGQSDVIDLMIDRLPQQADDDEVAPAAAQTAPSGAPAAAASRPASQR